MPALSQLLMKAHDLKPRSMATSTLWVDFLRGLTSPGHSASQNTLSGRRV